MKIPSCTPDDDSVKLKELKANTYLLFYKNKRHVLALSSLSFLEILILMVPE